MLDHCARRQSKQILLVQTGYGAPQYLLRSLSVANMSGVSVRPRGGGSWCVLSGRWAIVGRLVHMCLVWAVAPRCPVTATRDVLERQ